MKILTDVTSVVLMLLILIGDLVLYLQKKLLKAVKKLKHKTKKITKKSVSKTKLFLNDFKNSMKNIKLPKLPKKPKEQVIYSYHKQEIKSKKSHKKKINIFPKRKKKRGRKSFSAILWIVRFKYFIAGITFSLLFVFLPLLIIVFLQDLPNPKTLSQVETAQTTKIYDRNNNLLYQIYANQNRTQIKLSEVPNSLKQATIAIEDKDFYIHPGFDISAIVRSAVSNLQGKQLQGGSTLTQQLIKSTLLTSETTIERKAKEIILAFWTERLYSKDQILEMYLNQVPFGGTSWGVEAASQTYFGKSAKDVSLAEAAFLAGIPRAPTIYSPYGQTPNAWKKRQVEVIDRMLELNYITKKQGEIAKKEKLTFQEPQTPIHAPHFVMYIKDLLAKKYGLPMLEKGGLIVKTTLDLSLQEKTQEIVTNEIDSISYLNVSNGAAVVANPQNGDILAMVGSKNYNDPNGGKVNLATAQRQPGSSIKLVTYTESLSNGFTAASIIDDSPVSYFIPGSQTYSPVNYDGRFHGRVPLRIAFANSYNIPAVKVLNTIGVDKMVSLGKKMGIKSWGDSKNYGLSITLGAAEATMLEMTQVYGVMANLGEKVDLNPILSIKDSKGNTLEEKNTIQKTKVVDNSIAYIISNILADNNARSSAFGPNSPLNIPGNYASVKTGTSDNKRDNWTIGYTKDFVVTTWVGNNDNSPMSQNFASGITGAAPIWNKIMTSLLQEKPSEPYPIPENVVQRQCQGRIEYFVKGTENDASCNNWGISPSPSRNPQRRERLFN